MRENTGLVLRDTFCTSPAGHQGDKIRQSQVCSFTDFFKMAHLQVTCIHPQLFLYPSSHISAKSSMPMYYQAKLCIYYISVLYS